VEIRIDSTLYSKKLSGDIKKMAKRKFKVKKPKVKTPKYTDKGK